MSQERKFEFDVDAVYCISLEDRSDRREIFRTSIQSRIENDVAYYIAERDADPVRGCYESHRSIAQYALDAGFKRILVFEDDVAPYPFSFKQVRWINKFISSRNFEALHLGYTMGKTWLTWFPFIARGRVVALHAYVISEEGCKILANTPYNGKPVDKIFKRQIKQHCAFPMMFRQHPATLTGSDIESIVQNEDEMWQRNWRKHLVSPIKNLWRTVLRVEF